MKFEYMQEFATLCETLNYSLCADMLYISQPTLTRHIQELEKELSVSLFERTARGITLTAAGELFLPYAKEALNLQERYRTDIAQYIEKRNGVQIIGSIYAMPQYGISSIIGAWNAKRPSCRLKILENDSCELFKWLRQGVIDYAFAREDFPEDNGDFERITITTDHLVCLVPLNHPFAGRQTISIRELKDEKILYFEKGPLMRNLFLGAGFSISDFTIGAKGRNALLLVKQGLGIMLEFRKPIDDSELGGFEILDVEPRIESQINFVYRPKYLTENGKAFMKFVREYVKKNSTASVIKSAPSKS